MLNVHTRRWWRRAVVAMIGAGMVALVPVVAVLAQTATPAAAITPGPVAATECTATALPVDFLGNLVQTPIAATTPVPFTSVPAGTAPDAPTTAAIITAVRQFVACYNTGDTLRLLALYDPHFLRRLFDPQGIMPVDTANDLISSVAKPQPPKEDELLSLLAIHTLVQLADGRVAVVLETDGGNPNPGGTDVDLFVFKLVDGRWLIDDAVKHINEVAATETATAVP